MSSGRTPRTSTVRYCWVQGHSFPLTTEPEERYAEFDRWLAAHDREVFKRGQQVFHEEHQCCAAVEEARNLLFRRGMPRWVKIAKLHELFSMVAR
jgi:hypothetical protein